MWVFKYQDNIDCRLMKSTKLKPLKSGLLHETGQRWMLIWELRFIEGKNNAYGKWIHKECPTAHFLHKISSIIPWHSLFVCLRYMCNTYSRKRVLHQCCYRMNDTNNSSLSKCPYLRVGSVWGGSPDPYHLVVPTSHNHRRHARVELGSVHKGWVGQQLLRYLTQILHVPYSIYKNHNKILLWKKEASFLA